MRNNAILVAVFLAFFPLAKSIAADDAFFPWAKGDSWVYNTYEKGKKDPFIMNVTIQGPWKDDDASGMIMAQKDHRGSMREFQTKNEKGFYIAKIGLSQMLTPEVYTRFTPAVPRVIFPLTPGTTVHWEGRLYVRMLMDKPIKFDGTVVGWEDIEVPAGKFHCIKLFYDQWRGKDHVQETAWYAEGVGQVKYEGGQYIKELKSYRVNAPK